MSEYRRLFEILEKVSVSSNVDDQIALLKEAITLGASIQEWSSDMPRETWLALLRHSLGKRYLDRSEGDRAADIERAIEAFEAAQNAFDLKRDTRTWVENYMALGRAYISRLRGDPQENLQKALEAFEPLLAVLDQQDASEAWAVLMSNLGYVYSQLKRDDRERNIDLAIMYLEAAGTVLTQQTNPNAWAGNQTNLGKAYAERRSGNIVDNLRKAIAAHEAALTVYTREVNLRRWAINQGNLGKSLLALVEAEGDVRMSRNDAAINIHRAIEALEAALDVTTRDTNPDEWAALQLSLGSAYSRNMLGKREDNVAKAVAAYERFLSGASRESEQLDWAGAQAQLGLLYLEVGAKSEADFVERAMHAFKAAETVYTRESFPAAWAQLQAGLGLAYLQRKQDERAGNLERAIDRLESALKVLMPENLVPQWWGNAQHYLGLALVERSRGEREADLERALAAFNAALTVRTRENFPELWAETQQSLADLYRQRLSGDPGQNIDLAISFCRAVQTVFTKSQHPEQWAAVELQIADHLLHHPQDRAGNIERAIAALQEASEVYTREARLDYWAYVQSLLGTAYRDRYIERRVDNLEESIVHYEAALSVFTRETAPHAWAQTLTGLGLTYTARISGPRGENIEKSLALYDQALSVHTRESWPRDWAMIQNNRGFALMERGNGERAQNIDDAIAAYQSAIEVYTNQPSRRLWAETQSNLGLAFTYRIRGSHADNLEQAIAAYEAALSVTTLEQFPDLWATIQGNLANARLDRIHGLPADNIDSAIQGYQNALKVHTQDKYPEDWARLQASLGAAFRLRLWGHRAENLERAIRAYERALTVLTREEYPGRWAFVSMHLGHVYRARVLGDPGENFNKTLTAYADAATIYTHESEPDNWALLQVNIGGAYLQTHAGVREENYDKARERLSAALAYIRVDTRPREHLLIMRSLGNIMAARADWKRALEHYEAGIATFRFLFGAGLDETDARDVIEHTGLLFADAAYVAAKLGDLQRAFTLLEEGKAKLLSLSLRLDALRLTAEQRARRDELTAKIRDVERSYQAAVGTARSAALTLQKTLRQELAELVSAARGSGTGADDNDPISRIVTFLGTGQVIVAPVITDEGGMILVAAAHDAGIRFSAVDAPGLTRQKIEEFAVGTERATQLGGWFGAYLANYVPRYEQQQKWKEWFNAIEGLGPSLWNLVGKTIGETLATAGIEHGAELIILPQGTLGILPIGLAQDPTRGRRLMDEYIVTYMPSLAALMAIHDRLEAQKPGTPPTLAAIVNPTSDLKFSLIEGALITSHFARDRQVVLKEKDAGLDAVLSALKGRDYWHFASHGKFHWMDASASGLLLKNKEVLSVRALLRSYGLGMPRLVVLSACETGLYDTTRTPEEFSGLPTAFVQLGAAGVLSTLWPVNDLSTALLMSKFYDLHRDQGLAPARALALAQTWLREASLESLREYGGAAVKAGRLPKDLAGTLTHLRADSGEQDDDSFEELATESRVQRPAQKRSAMAPTPSAHQRPFEHPFYWGGFILTGR
jgi:CHAT domain-containing protein/tetratricopeptide (TPR) repeat protein